MRSRSDGFPACKPVFYTQLKKLLFVALQPPDARFLEKSNASYHICDS
jgi:hypothetical protein